MQQGEQRRDTRRKVVAILAGGAALGLGVSASLAAWTDTEWIFGGDSTGGPGIGTSSFSVQQNTVAPFGAGTWTDEADNPGGEIVFGPDALSLTPGDAVFANVALRTSADSVEGDVTLAAAVPAAGIVTDDPAGLLFGALGVRVVTDDAAFTCDATAFSGAPGAPTLIADGALATTGGSTAQALAAAAGSVQYYCFEIELDAAFTPAPGSTTEDYQGLSIAPAWEFLGESA